MTLGEILSGVRLKQPISPELAATNICGLDYDSRRVREGFLFFAFPGSRADGRQFAGDALARGAAAVASESEKPDAPGCPLGPPPWIRGGDGRPGVALGA